MDVLVRFIRDNKLPEDKKKAHRIKLRSARFACQPKDISIEGPSLEPYCDVCTLTMLNFFLFEIHKGVCRSHSGEHLLPIKP